MVLMRCLLTSRSTNGQGNGLRNQRWKEGVYMHEGPDVGVAAWINAGAALGSTPQNAVQKHNHECEVYSHRLEGPSGALVSLCEQC